MVLELPSVGSRSSFHLTEERVREIEKAADKLEEMGVDVNTWASIIDRALRHYTESLGNAEEIKGHITPEQARVISTSEVQIIQQSYVKVPK